MGSHPANLTLRFILELCALAAVGVWGWQQSESWLRFVFALGLPFILAVIWGSFAVPNDPSRSGNAPIITPGFVRLIIELSIFGFAAWSLYNMGDATLSFVLGGIVVVHYSLSYDRIKWLLAH
jgi:hypothetical protein